MAQTLLLAALLLGCCAGCGGTMIEPGHRGLLFDPGRGGEISAVAVEAIKLPPEVVTAMRDRQVAEENARRRKIELESEAAKQKLQADQAWEREKIELERNVERRRLQRAAEGH